MERGDLPPDTSLSSHPSSGDLPVDHRRHPRHGHRLHRRSCSQRDRHAHESRNQRKTRLGKATLRATTPSPSFPLATTPSTSRPAASRNRSPRTSRWKRVTVRVPTLHLELGAESTVIEVTASTPLLQADSATVSSTVTAKAVQDLPLNGRNFVQLVALVPGANEGAGQRSEQRRPPR